MYCEQDLFRLKNLTQQVSELNNTNQSVEDFYLALQRCRRFSGASLYETTDLLRRTDWVFYVDESSPLSINHPLYQHLPASEKIDIVKPVTNLSLILRPFVSLFFYYNQSADSNDKNQLHARRISMIQSTFGEGKNDWPIKLIWESDLSVGNPNIFFDEFISSVKNAKTYRLMLITSGREPGLMEWEKGHQVLTYHLIPINEVPSSVKDLTREAFNKASGALRPRVFSLLKIWGANQPPELLPEKIAQLGLVPSRHHLIRQLYLPQD